MQLSKSILLIVSMLGFISLSGQVQKISLEQTTGAFSNTSLDLAPGQYQFEISNNNVGHDVGFVLVPKGKYDQSNHIQEAYVTEVVKNNESSMTGIVNLAPGEYEYFCPMNPTPKYSLTIHDDIETVRLGQVEGKFKVESLTVSEGKYQFEIANNGVEQEVGFVLVPKGQYEQTNHIPEAYVKNLVADGTSSLTGIVDLEAGDYEYFCPLNPTPKYTLTVVK